MPQEQQTKKQDALRLEFEASRVAFHDLLNSLSAADLKKKSLNASWTNGELLFHMALAFFVLTSLLPLVRLFGHFPKAFSHPLAQLLNSCTRPFNWINALGTRLGGRVMTPKSLGKTFDWANAHLVKALYTFSNQDWQRCGMYAPTRWDAVSFKDYMTLEDLFRMPLLHFAFHRGQLT